jgi:tmRNA-binding protein
MSQNNRPATPKARISVARNPRASHDYHLLETWETGIVLTGTEVKSLRHGKASIKEAYALVRNGKSGSKGCTLLPTSRAIAGIPRRSVPASC